MIMNCFLSTSSKRKAGGITFNPPGSEAGANETIAGRGMEGSEGVSMSD